MSRPCNRAPLIIPRRYPVASPGKRTNHPHARLPLAASWNGSSTHWEFAFAYCAHMIHDTWRFRSRPKISFAASFRSVLEIHDRSRTRKSNPESDVIGSATREPWEFSFIPRALGKLQKVQFRRHVSAREVFGTLLFLIFSIHSIYVFYNAILF